MIIGTLGGKPEIFISNKPPVWRPVWSGTIEDLIDLIKDIRDCGSCERIDPDNPPEREENG